MFSEKQYNFDSSIKHKNANLPGLAADLQYGNFQMRRSVFDSVCIFRLSYKW